MDPIGLGAQRERIGDGVDAAIRRVLDHGRFILGPEVGQLEQALSERAGAHAITCANGTDALVLAFMALGVGRGDAVVVPSFTFCATAEAVRLVGAEPVFADVDRHTALLSAATLEPALAAATAVGLPVRAVVTVDLFGQPVAPGAIGEVAAAAGAVVVSDAAQSFGATFEGVPVGGLAPITTTSFFPSKPLGCYGDGGALFVVDEAQVELLRSLRFHGQGRHKYDNVRVGMNSRLDTIQAAVLLEKLVVFDAELAARRAVAARYHDALPDAVRPLEVDPRSASAWAQFSVTVEHRPPVLEAARAAGIATPVYYQVPLHRQPAYASSPASADLSNSEWLCEHVLSLPMHPYLSQDDVAKVVEVVAGAVAARPPG